MMIDGRELSEPEVRAYIKSHRSRSDSSRRRQRSTRSYTLSCSS